MQDVSSREMNIYGKLLALDSPEADRLRHDWHEPKVGANDLKIGSRSINYYEAIGLIRDPRGGEKKGWRRYSYIECVYLSIVRELRHYGIDTDYIKTFYDTFVKDDDELFTNSILLAHLGYKMTIVIEPNQKEHIFDTNDLVNRESEKEDSLRSSEIRVNLTSIVRKTNNLIAGQLLPLEPDFWYNEELNDEGLKTLRNDWSEQENMLIDRFRSLKPEESFTVKRTKKGDTYTEYTEYFEIDKKLEKSLVDVAGDYSEITIRTSGGKAARGKVSKSTKL